MPGFFGPWRAPDGPERLHVSFSGKRWNMWRLNPCVALQISLAIPWPPWPTEEHETMAWMMVSQPDHGKKAKFLLQRHRSHRGWEDPWFLFGPKGTWNLDIEIDSPSARQHIGRPGLCHYRNFIIHRRPTALGIGKIAVGVVYAEGCRRRSPST
jgi:hypothetical protein